MSLLSRREREPNMRLSLRKLSYFYSMRTVDRLSCSRAARFLRARGRVGGRTPDRILSESIKLLPSSLAPSLPLLDGILSISQYWLAQSSSRARSLPLDCTGSSKKTMLSSVTHVPSGLMGCASVSGGRKAGNSNMQEYYCTTLY